MTIESAQAHIPQWSTGDRLRKAREDAGLDTGTFAAEIGVARQTIGRAERDETTPRRSLLLLWSMKTGVPVEWLETGKAPSSPDGDNGASRDASTAPARSKWAPRDSNPKPAD